MTGDIPGLGQLLDILRQSGPAGAIVAAVIVGLTISIIILARFRGLWANVGTEARQAQFQAQCLAMIADLRATEQALRARLESESRGREMLQDEVEDFRVQIALLRHQRRRLVEMLRRFVASLPEPAVRVHRGGGAP